MPSPCPPYPSVPAASTPRVPRHDRAEAALKLMAFEEARARGLSQRAAAEEAEIPRTTALYWQSRREASALPRSVAVFLESPDGLAWFRRVVLAAVFVMTLRGPEGIRLVCEFLELCGLSELVASSFGSVQEMTLSMQREAAAFAEEQRADLGARMEPCAVTVCEDETFHPRTCLVGIEPASGFILLEGYVPRRDAATWNEAMKDALEGLPVTVMQSTSDQGKALLRHARDAGAHHSPDLFHPQHDLSKATALALAARVRRKTEEHGRAEAHLAQVIGDRDAFRRRPRGPGRPPNHDGRVAKAQEFVAIAAAGITAALKDQQRCREAIAGLSADYHPYQLTDGAVRSASDVASLLDARFAVIDEVATKAGLSERCRELIDKARRVMPELVETIAFAHGEVAVRLAGLDVAPDIRAEVATKLVPGLYLQRVAGRAQLAADRRALRSTAESLLAPLRVLGHPLTCLDEATTERVTLVAEACADVFQRSSSCVEGRNGRLALFHHGLHRLTDDKLAALTAVHNFHVRRPDGTTAARRFFGLEHDDLFTRLLERMPQLSRPARPRSPRVYRLADGRAA